MTQQWRVRVHGVVRRQPDVEQLVRVVFLLAEELQRQDVSAVPHDNDGARPQPFQVEEVDGS